MTTIPSKVADRLTAGIKRFQSIIASAKTRDVNESDTCVVVTDVLSEVFGYDKYSEITTEYAIRGTFCDLAIKTDGKPRLLLEVKAIGIELKDAHIKQAVDYAANQGVEWVVLTNAVQWRIYRVIFGQPIERELVIEVDYLALNPKAPVSLEALFLITKEGISRSVLDEYHSQRQAMSRFFIGQMLLTDALLEVLRRELRRCSPGVRIELAELKAVLEVEVLKRDVLEGDKADDARRKICRAAGRALRVRQEKASGGGEAVRPEVVPAVPLPASVPTV